MASTLALLRDGAVSNCRGFKRNLIWFESTVQHDQELFHGGGESKLGWFAGGTQSQIKSADAAAVHDLARTNSVTAGEGEHCFRFIFSLYLVLVLLVTNMTRAFILCDLVSCCQNSSSNESNNTRR